MSAFIQTTHTKIEHHATMNEHIVSLCIFLLFICFSLCRHIPFCHIANAISIGFGEICECFLFVCALVTVVCTALCMGIKFHRTCTRPCGFVVRYADIHALNIHSRKDVFLWSSWSQFLPAVDTLYLLVQICNGSVVCMCICQCTYVHTYKWTCSIADFLFFSLIFVMVQAYAICVYDVENVVTQALIYPRPIAYSLSSLLLSPNSISFHRFSINVYYIWLSMNLFWSYSFQHFLSRNIARSNSAKQKQGNTKKKSCSRK